MRWMDTAWTQQGVHETAGEGATPEIVAMFREVGATSVTSDETPWCAAFVGACLERSGIRSTPTPAPSSNVLEPLLKPFPAKAREVKAT